MLKMLSCAKTVILRIALIIGAVGVPELYRAALGRVSTADPACRCINGTDLDFDINPVESIGDAINDIMLVGFPVFFKA